MRVFSSGREDCFLNSVGIATFAAVAQRQFTRVIVPIQYKVAFSERFYICKKTDVRHMIRCKAALTRASSPVKKQNTYGSLIVVQRIDLPYEILIVVRRFRHGGIHFF